jgi:hypothetical protein
MRKKVAVIVSVCLAEAVSIRFAYSIATDNGDLTAVWASDGSGAMWTAE